MNTTIWDGTTLPGTIPLNIFKMRERLASAAKGFRWSEMMDILLSHPELVNCSRIGSTSLYTPLHQAAYGGAPVEIIRQLLSLGAWRSIRTAKLQRAVDIAREKGHGQLCELLEPVYLRYFQSGDLARIQGYCHKVIMERAGNLVVGQKLRLPELEPLLENDWIMQFELPNHLGRFDFSIDNHSPLMVRVAGWHRDQSGLYNWNYAVSPNGILLLNQVLHT